MFSLLVFAAKTAGELAVSQILLGINSAIAVYVASKPRAQQSRSRRKR